MAMKAKTRSSLYDTLVPIVGDEEVVDDLLAQFPARDVDEPVTRDFVRAEVADLRTYVQGEIAALRTYVQGEIAVLRAEVHTEIADLRAEVHTEIAAVHTEIATLRTEVRTETAGVRTEMHQAFADAHRQTVTWLISIAALVVTLNAAMLGAAVAILQ